MSGDRRGIVTSEMTNELQLEMPDAAVRRLRDRDELAERVRDTRL